MIHQLHGIECIPLCTHGSQQLLRCKAHLLLISHVKQLELLHQNMKPMLRIQRLSSRRECGWVRLQEILVRTGPLGTVGTTPFPAIASVASTGKATNSLG